MKLFAGKNQTIKFLENKNRQLFFCYLRVKILLVLSLLLQISFLKADDAKQEGFFEKGITKDFSKGHNITEKSNIDKEQQLFAEQAQKTYFEDLPEEVKLALKDPKYISSLIDCSKQEYLNANLKDQLDLSRKTKLPQYLTFCIGLLDQNKKYYDLIYGKINTIKSKEELKTFLSNPEDFLNQEIEAIKKQQAELPSFVPDLTEEEKLLPMEQQKEIAYQNTKNAVNLFKRLMPGNEIPEKYKNIKMTPTWIIGTEKGEILFEGVDVGGVANILNKAKAYIPETKSGETGLETKILDPSGDQKQKSNADKIVESKSKPTPVSIDSQINNLTKESANPKANPTLKPKLKDINTDDFQLESF